MYECFLKEVISKQNTKDWIARENCVYSRTEWQDGVGLGERVERRGVMCKDPVARESRIGRRHPRSRYASNPKSTDPCLSILKTS